MTKSKRALKADERRRRERAAKRVKPRGAPKARAGSDHDVLGPRSEVSPSLLIRGTADIVGEFVVALAAIFDDLKDLAAFEQPMLPTRPEPGDMSVAAGEWRGRHHTIHRFIAGVLHELIELIASKRKILDEVEFKECIARISAEARADWQAIVEIALRIGDENTAMRQTLAYVRNNASFHYTALGEIGKGWQKVFVDDPKSDANRAAVYCLGANMETTRFHFADAAFEAVMFRGTDRLQAIEAIDGKSFDKRLLDTVSKVNVALRFLIAAYIRQRSESRA